MQGKKITIELTVEQWNIVLQGVGQLPLGQVLEIYASMKTQADAQLEANGDKQNQPE